MSDIGHNSGGVNAPQLQSVVQRIEWLEQDAETIKLDIKEVYAEAKSNGFDPKILRQLIRLRKQDPAKREEAETLLALYERAVGDA